MGILREAVQREIMDILDSSIYRSNDFIITFGNSKKEGYLLLVDFFHNERFSFMIEADEGYYVTTKTLGVLVKEESKSFLTLEEAIRLLPIWCDELQH